MDLPRKLPNGSLDFDGTVDSSVNDIFNEFVQSLPDVFTIIGAVLIMLRGLYGMYG
jgi:hypothetical protein